MKFKKFLAALLGVMMVTSVMSFTAKVSAVESSLIKESTYHQKYGAERGQTSVQMYDAVNDIVFSRMTPSTTEANANSSCYINISGQSVIPTVEQVAADTIYIVFYVRTNMTLDDNDNPSLSIYQAFWGEENVKANGSATLVTGNDNFITKTGNDWGKMCFKLGTTAKVDHDNDTTTATVTRSVNKWTQFAYLAVGLAGTNPIKDWAAKAPEGEEPNMDCAGYAVLSSLEAAESYDFTQSAKAPRVTLTFDKNIAGDESDITTTEVASGKWDTASKVQFPTVTHTDENYVFAGWYNGTTMIEDTSALAVPSANTTYTAQWYTKNPQLSSLTINGTTPDKFSVSDINADVITVKLPYGWERLEALGVMPDVIPTADEYSTAVYTSPASLSDAGKITISSGEYTKEITVTFTVGTATVKSKLPTAGVFSNIASITLPNGTEITSGNGIQYRGGGLKPEKTTFKGVTGYKYTPVYKGSRYDGTPVNENSKDYYTNARGVNLEGYNAFGLYDFESYDAYRVLAYIDTGANGKFDVAPVPAIYLQGNDTTGTVKASGTGATKAMLSVNNYVGDRWEYIYFVKNSTNEKLYGKARQPVFAIFGNKGSTNASSYTDDVFYCANIEMLPDVPDFVQYKPTGLAATAIDVGISGTVTGLSDDMEMLVGETWTAVTSVSGYSDGTLTVTEPRIYSFRYAATDVLLASDATDVEVISNIISATVCFDPQNGDEVTEYILDKGNPVTVPADPVKQYHIFKGWAETADGTIPVDLTNVTVSGNKTYYAIWELIDKIYVDGTAESSSDGLTADAPVATFKEAWDKLSTYGGTIVIMDDTVLDSRYIDSKHDYRLVNGNGDIVITNKDGDTTYDGKLIFAYQSQFVCSANATGKLKFENLNIVQEHSYGGAEKNIYRYVNFNGLEVEFGEGVNVVSTSDADGYTGLKMRAGGEFGATHYGRKIIIRSGEWAAFILGGKNNSSKPYSLDVEYYGGVGTLSLGNDSNIAKKDLDGDGVEENYYVYGRMQDAKLLFESAPTNIGISHIDGIDGTFQLISNNGANVTIPSFSWTNTNDTTTNPDGTVFTADLTPKGGYWIINSKEGGRADFTETTGTFTVKTEKAYIVVFDNATGKSTTFQVPDDEYRLALENGRYDIYYTDDPESLFNDVTIKVDLLAKEGATSKNTTYLAFSPADENHWSFIALEETGNGSSVEKVVSDTFFANKLYDIKVLKNGYLTYDLEGVTISSKVEINAELAGGDLKGSASGTAADAVDLGDFGDGKVDISDFVRLIRAFDGGASEEFRNSVDINEDGAITVADLAIIKANYLKTSLGYYYTDKGYAKIAELDELEANRIAKIRATESMDIITNNIIYVSSSIGDDSNNGLSEEHPVKTLAKANSLVKANGGWAVLLKRGDLWRERMTCIPGTTYSAYGSGDKPKIYGSPENGADPDKWTLVYENEDTGALIWKYAREDFLDVGTMVFDDGEGFAMKEVPSCVGADYYVRGQENLPVEDRTPFDYTVELDNNLEFFHSANSTITKNTTIGDYINIGTATGPLYLRCDNGNPGKVFSSIEFNTRPSAITARDNVTIDNLCIMYAGVHGISSGTVNNLTVTNCEIGWIGGSIQGYTANGNTKRSATRLGNGIEVYGGCQGYTIDNCYIYQCYDAGVTHQYSHLSVGNCIMNDVTYSNNLITECVYSIEYFLESSDEYTRCGDNILFEGNFMRRAGYGFGSFRPDGNNQRHIRSSSRNNPFTNYRIINNIFDRSVYELFQTQTDRDLWKPSFDGNTFIQGIGNYFCTHAYYTRSTFGLDAPELIKTVLGDENAQVYFVDYVPYWAYDYAPSKTVPVTDDDRS